MVHKSSLEQKSLPINTDPLMSTLKEVIDANQLLEQINCKYETNSRNVEKTLENAILVMEGLESHFVFTQTQETRPNNRDTLEYFIHQFNNFVNYLKLELSSTKSFFDQITKNKENYLNVETTDLIANKVASQKSDQDMIMTNSISSFQDLLAKSGIENRILQNKISSPQLNLLNSPIAQLRKIESKKKNIILLKKELNKTTNLLSESVIKEKDTQKNLVGALGKLKREKTLNNKIKLEYQQKLIKSSINQNIEKRNAELIEQLSQNLNRISTESSQIEEGNLKQVREHCQQLEMQVTGLRKCLKSITRETSVRTREGQSCVVEF